MALQRESYQGELKEQRPHVYRAREARPNLPRGPLPFRVTEIPHVQEPEILPSKADMVTAISDFAVQTLKTADRVRFQKKLPLEKVVEMRPAQVATIEILENDRVQDLPSLADAPFLIKYNPNDTTSTGLRRSIIGFVHDEDTGEITTHVFRMSSELEAKFSSKAPTDTVATNEELTAIWRITQDPQILRETPRIRKETLPYALRPLSHAPRRGTRDFGLYNFAPLAK